MNVPASYPQGMSPRLRNRRNRVLPSPPRTRPKPRCARPRSRARRRPALAARRSPALPPEGTSARSTTGGHRPPVPRGMPRKVRSTAAIGEFAISRHGAVIKSSPRSLRTLPASSRSQASSSAARARFPRRRPYTVAECPRRRAVLIPVSAPGPTIGPVVGPAESEAGAECRASAACGSDVLCSASRRPRLTRLQSQLIFHFMIGMPIDKSFDV